MPLHVTSRHPTDIMIYTQGTRLILNLRDVAVNRAIEPAVDVTLELMAVQYPAPEPCLG